jgi:hypothetical protein
MSVTISGTTGVATPGVQNSADETIAGTLTVTGATTAGVIKSTSTSQPSTFQNSEGTEIGVMCRAWVNFTASASPTINNDFNIATVARTGAGQYTITFTNPMPNATYAVIATPQNVGYVDWNVNLFNSALTTTGFSITTAHGTSTGDVGGIVSVVVFG